MEEKEERIQITLSDEGDFIISFFSQPLLGSKLCARIGKEKAKLLHAGNEKREWGTLWILEYQHPTKKDQTFEGRMEVHTDYILFETSYGFDQSVKKNKSIYGNPYISFPSFEGEEWSNKLSGLTFKRQAPFNYPVRWQGRAVDCLREGKNVPLLVTTKTYETVILSPLEPLLHSTVSVTHHPPRIRCGIPRAVTGVNKGDVSRTLLAIGNGVHATWMQWGQVLREQYGVHPINQQEDRSLEYISYWTNAGSAYWYNNRTFDSYESIFKSLQQQHKEKGLSYGSYQMDSWWYHKDGDSYTSGIVEWEPKAIVKSKNFNAMLPFLQRYKDIPLFEKPSFDYVQSWLKTPIGCHYKQLAPNCVYVKERPEDYWVDELALPKGKEATKRHFHKIFHHPQWQLSYVIHDWLQLMNDRHDGFMDSQVGKDYFVGLDEACLEIDAPMNQSGHLGLQLCMTQPHMTLQSVAMQSVTSIRSTSDAESFFVEGTKRWWWHLFSSHYIQALGKYAFYDHRHTKSRHSHPRSSNAPFELIWIGLSCGPMGIGDAIGKEDINLIKKGVTSEGKIIQPDFPAAPLNQCYTHLLFHKKAIYGAITQTMTKWSSYHIYYALLFGVHPFGKRVQVSYQVTEFHYYKENPGTEYSRYDYLTKECERIEGDMAYNYLITYGHYHYHIIAPIRENAAFIGDVSKHVTAGKQLVEDVKVDEHGVMFIFKDRPSDECMEWVCYMEKEPNQVLVDGESVAYTWEKGKLSIPVMGRGDIGAQRQCKVETSL